MTWCVHLLKSCWLLVFQKFLRPIRGLQSTILSNTRYQQLYWSEPRHGLNSNKPLKGTYKKLTSILQQVDWWRWHLFAHDKSIFFYISFNLLTMYTESSPLVSQTVDITVEKKVKTQLLKVVILISGTIQLLHLCVDLKTFLPVHRGL